MEAPEGCVRVPTEEPGHWVFKSRDVLAEVRFRSGEREALEFTLQGIGESVVETQGFRFVVEGCVVGWLAGATGRMLLDGAAWVMLSGWCGEGGAGPEGRVALVLGGSAGLVPGRRAWSCWRLYPEHEIPPLPAWLPPERYLPEGEAIEVPDLDVACTGNDLVAETVDEGSAVRGPVSCHELAVHGSNGVSFLEIGWYLPMEQLVPKALKRAGNRADLEAWLLTWLLAQPGLGERERLLDQLDLALGDCLETPGLWSVLAGLRAAQITDLPIRGEVEAAASGFSVEEALTAEGLIGGAALTAHPSSARIDFTARDVTLTRFRLDGKPESPAQQELEHGLRGAGARLRCALSTDPDPEAVAWLLLGSPLG